MAGFLVVRCRVTAAALLLVAGCGTRGVTPVASRAYDIGRAPREQVGDGGTLRLATTEFPAQWNYWHLGGTDLDTARTLRAMMPWLFRSDQNGTVTADPDYLTGGRVTRTRPKQVVTYDINPKATWSDGTPLGYRDFRALWRACDGHDPAYEVTASTGYERVESVERGISDRQVVVTFARPFGEWRALFSPLYPARMISTPAAWNTAWSNRIPVTAGPFRPERIDRTAETISLVRDPAWWGRRARLDRVVFRRLARDAMPEAFASGEIDAFDAGADAAVYRRAATVPGATVRGADGPDFSQLTLNAGAPALASVDVRRAVMLAVDRQAIARAVLPGLGRAARPLDDHVYVNTQRGYRDNAGDLGAYDPVRARWLLARAGWRLDGRVRRRNGRPLALRYVYPVSAAASRQSGEMIQEMLGRVGIRLELRPVADGAFFAGHLIPGDFDLAPFSWIGSAFPISAMRSIYGRPRKGGLQQNLARVGSRRLDALLDRAIAEPDPAKARFYANRADEMIWREGHSLPLYQRPQIVPVRSTLANWGAFGLADPVWMDVGFTR